MTEKIQKQYGEDKNIHNLWSEESNISLETLFTRPPYTQQTLNKWRKKFRVDLAWFDDVI